MCDIFEKLNSDLFLEKKCVTFKYLSGSECIHVNKAKNLLWEFLQKKKDQLSAVYLVSGFVQDEEGKRLRLMLCSDVRLDDCIGQMSPLLGFHVYSLEPKPSNPPDSLDYLYTADTETCSLDPMLSGVRSSSSEEMRSGNVVSQFPDPGIKVDVSKETKKNEHAPCVEKARKKELSSVDGTKEKTFSASSFFGKAKVKREVPPEKSKEAFKNATTKQPVSFFGKVEEKVQPKNHIKCDATKTKSKPNESQTGKKRVTETSNQGAKYKRIVALDSSDEESQESDVTSDEPIDIQLEIPEAPEESLSPEKSVSYINKDEKVETDDRVRNRKRKLVSHTYMDDEGFLLTEKKWESGSCSEGGSEEKNGSAPNNKMASSKVHSSPIKEKQSPQKGGGKKGGGKQTNIMSFFAAK